MGRLDVMQRKYHWPEEAPQYPKGMNCEQYNPDPKFACKAAACAIQACLAVKDYQQRRCAREVQELVECCKILPESSPSVHCQGFGINRRKPAPPPQVCVPSGPQGPPQAPAAPAQPPCPTAAPMLDAAQSGATHAQALPATMPLVQSLPMQATALQATGSHAPPACQHALVEEG